MNENQNIAPSPADDLIQKYEALTKKASDLLYPRSSKATENWPDTSEWKWFKTLSYYFDKPYLPTISHASGITPFITILLRLISFIFMLGFVTIVVNWSTINSGGYQPETNTWAVLAIGASSLFCFLLAINNTILSLRYSSEDKKFIPILYRIILPVLLFSATFIFEVNQPVDISVITVLFLLFYPGYIVLVENMPQAIAWVLEILINILKAVYSFHKPQQTLLINKLLHSKIDGKRTVLELSQIQIETIGEWAKTNQETSEKRLNPLLIVLAFLALFAGSKWFESQFLLVKNFLIAFFADNITLESLFGIILTSLLFLFIGIFFTQIVLIFQNIGVQSLIAETCIVAEYTVKMMEVDTRKQEEQIPQNPTFFQKLKNCFCKKDYNQP